MLHAPCPRHFPRGADPEETPEGPGNVEKRRREDEDDGNSEGQKKLRLWDVPASCGDIPASAQVMAAVYEDCGTMVTQLFTRLGERARETTSAYTEFLRKASLEVEDLRNQNAQLSTKVTMNVEALKSADNDHMAARKLIADQEKKLVTKDNETAVLMRQNDELVADNAAKTETIKLLDDHNQRAMELLEDLQNHKTKAEAGQKALESMNSNLKIKLQQRDLIVQDLEARLAEAIAKANMSAKKMAEMQRDVSDAAALLARVTPH
ncbi:hypothetical protein K438DRAFT_1839465 [Mycena galopus ATCC 62051]|nr:hypothetical protein K438DRAFT_1839465 [Mycena galopus ATCC 62051]